MSLRNKISAKFSKPCVVFYRAMGALLLEFGDAELQALGRACLNKNVQEKVKAVCDQGYAPALSVKEYKHNQALCNNFTKVLDHEFIRQKRNMEW